MRRRISLPLKLFVICFAFVLSCIILISQLSYRYVRSEMRTNDEYYIKQIMDKVDQYLTVNFSSFQTILFSLETSVQANLQNPEVIRKQVGKLYEMNSNYVSNIYLIKSDLSVIGGSMPTRIFDEPLPERKPLFEAATRNKQTTYESEPYLSRYSGWTLTMVRYLPGSDEPMAVAVDLDLKAIEATLLQIHEEEQMNLALLTSSGQIIAGFSDSKVPQEMRNHTFSVGGMSGTDLIAANGSNLTVETRQGKPVSVQKRPTEKFNWYIVSVNDESRLKAALDRLRQYYLGLLLAGLLLSFLIAYLIAKYIRKPLYYLMTKMNRVEQGELGVVVSVRRNDEFGDLSRAFDHMLQQIVDLLKRSEKHNELQRKLEIQVLQSQINPHFLYNTLGSISHVARLGQLDKIDTVIGSLISLLEYGISDASEQVALRDELRNVADYVAIQNIRYNRHFQLVERIEDGLPNYPVFRMLLQPLVENSLFHGYCGGQIEGPLEISAFREGGFVAIEVADRGVGIPEEKLALLLTPEPRDGDARRRRIGLNNIHQRIRTYYGKPHGLQIVSVPGQGTRIRALFPAHPTKELQTE
ncbi:cache domain-containing sensor histidine kinase [Cohnella zeiphila]|uniref:Histidine kinase n=1 Tax=Cohnella zeiphila TaxID=2761120 RepID=A0A7X0VUT4_9BACL|nr:sensor histidine kinase [Cohnella zeiphila]MBB6731256.1 histidine kinase [Cohnella zeiphila]